MLGSKSTGGFGIADTCGFTISLSHSLLIAGADTKPMAAFAERNSQFSGSVGGNKSDHADGTGGRKTSSEDLAGHFQRGRTEPPAYVSSQLLLEHW